MHDNDFLYQDPWAQRSCIPPYAVTQNSFRSFLLFTLAHGNDLLLQALGPDVMRQAYSLITKHDVEGLQGLYQNSPALVTPPKLPDEALLSWWAPNVSSSSPLYTVSMNMLLCARDRTVSRAVLLHAAESVCVCVCACVGCLGAQASRMIFTVLPAIASSKYCAHCLSV